MAELFKNGENFKFNEVDYSSKKMRKKIAEIKNNRSASASQQNYRRLVTRSGIRLLLSNISKNNYTTMYGNKSVFPMIYTHF